MRKMLISLLLISIILSGCSNKLSQNELFQKKQDCMNLKSGITTEINQKFFEYKEQFIQAINKDPYYQPKGFSKQEISEINTDFVNQTNKVRFGEIFYSSKLYSCLYTFKIQGIGGDTLIISDYLNHKDTMVTRCNYGTGTSQCDPEDTKVKEFEQQLKELKGE